MSLKPSIEMTIKLLLAVLLAWLALELTASGSESDEWKSQDKRQHVAAGAAVGAISYALVETFAPELKGWKKHALAIGASAIVGAAKEYADSRDSENHTCDFRDFAATAAGGVLGSISVSFAYRF